ncbi:MAG TPA: hypothetical protein VK741_25840 [Acetobacteraceae bacterium]|jgi:hypothetical protein|nr:hypothetical protein [Acetobacteraceae bacterium]
MSTMAERLRERQVVFAVPPAAKTGILEVFFVIPDGAWDVMRGGIGQEFDLVKVGVPLQVAMTRCRDRATGIAMLRARGLTMEPNPKAGPDWILLAFAKLASAGVPLLMFLIPDAARDGLRSQVHQFDLRDRGLPVIVQITARPTHADCMAEVQRVMADEQVRDMRTADVSFAVDAPVTRQ